ncbi:MAG: ribosomal L7Ae/L30e/S12e/Gadd45 family protein [Nanoarchaeota archaeon]|nr:ribosomal L7Ae/L30e/S12e/Gadd45 family protein [Nanoarchaeota archaeon]
MTATKEIKLDTKTLKTKIQDKKVVIGTERVLKELKLKKIQAVYLARNCPDKVKEDIKYYAALADIPVQELAYSNEELGVFCKKSFLVSVLGTIGE